MKVNEIFDSLQGEQDGFGGQGKPTTFIRLQGCNLPTPCSYCDTTKAFYQTDGIEMSIDKIMERINMPKVTITGGEPLAQYNNTMELTRRLIEHEIPITIETNGSIWIHGEFPNLSELPHRIRELWVRIVMDYKLPSSGIEKFMDAKAFELLYSWDVIKFVIVDDIDYIRMKELLAERKWKAQIVISPVLSNPTELLVARVLAQKMVNDSDLRNAQFNLQLHKLLGVK